MFRGVVSRLSSILFETLSDLLHTSLPAYWLWIAVSRVQTASTNSRSVSMGFAIMAPVTTGPEGTLDRVESVPDIGVRESGVGHFAPYAGRISHVRA